MIALTTFALGLGAAAAMAIDHPTLSTNWVATTWQPETPDPSGDEAYRFVDKPTDANPSALWSNYSESNCKRLLRSGSYEDQTRYYLKCHSVDCCKCDTRDAGNQIEFQIPNVHPSWIASITHTVGNCDFPQSGQPTVQGADVWHWKFGPAAYTAFTRQCPTCNVTGPGTELLRWDIHIATENITIEWQNYTIPANDDVYLHTFDVPPQCRANNILNCCDQEKRSPQTPVQRAAAFMAKHGLPGNQTSWL